MAAGGENRWPYLGRNRWPLTLLANSHGEKLVDLVFYLRRRRYVTSHGVGLLLRLAGLEGTYAVTLTALGAIYSTPGTRPARSPGSCSGRLPSVSGVLEAGERTTACVEQSGSPRPSASAPRSALAPWVSDASELEPRRGRHHRRSACVYRRDDLLDVYSLQVDARGAEV